MSNSGQCDLGNGPDDRYQDGEKQGIVDLLVMRAVNGGGEESFGLRIF